MDQLHYPHLTDETVQRILNNIYNEIYVTDGNMKILYVGQACLRHYGLTQEEMIGHSHKEFAGIYWNPSVLPLAYREKRRSCIEHVTVKGERITTISNPAYNDDGTIRMVVSLVQDIDDPVDLSFDSLPGEGQTLLQRRQQELSCDFLTASAEMADLIAMATRAAASDAPVLIQGESGCGKTMLARYIHEHSTRVGAPFLAINCAAIPENLLESELFGYVPHAFTGASAKGKTGLISTADHGTLFLDEIGELPLRLQSKILMVVEQQKFSPIGSSRMQSVNVRILVATNKDLEQMVRERLFREDLYWRLNVVDLHIPPLRSRGEDILPLAHYFLYYYNRIYESNRIFSPQVLEVFLRYPWPGNIRQLKNIIDRAFVLSSGPTIIVEDLPPIMVQQVADTKAVDTETAGDSLSTRVAALEGPLIRGLYRQHPSSRRLAAAIQVTQTKANQLIRQYCRE